MFVFSTLEQMEIRRDEAIEAAKILGIEKENVTILDYPNRRFDEFRQGILQNLVDLEKEIKPDLVLVPCRTDRHQDHEVVTAEAIRAFKKTTILGYEAPWNMTESSLPVTVLLSAANIRAKESAVVAHKTQQHRPYTNKKFIWSLAEVRGLVAGGKYGESMEAIRWIL
jgi:LmbE family N-acetylglucosaminyl deacetylase